jgi:hypothetical protein
MLNWIGCGRRRPWPNLGYYNMICLEGLSNSQDSWSTGRYSNPGTAEYEAGLLDSRKRCSVLECTAMCSGVGHVSVAVGSGEWVYSTYCIAV